MTLGTNAFPSLLRRLRLHPVPVYDYVLMSEPLSPAQLDAVRRTPLPFPPGPLAFAGIQATRWSLQRVDRDEGRRNLWLRGLDRAVPADPATARHGGRTEVVLLW